MILTLVKKPDFLICGNAVLKLLPAAAPAPLVLEPRWSGRPAGRDIFARGRARREPPERARVFLCLAAAEPLVLHHFRVKEMEATVN